MDPDPDQYGLFDEDYASDPDYSDGEYDHEAEEDEDD